MSRCQVQNILHILYHNQYIDLRFGFHNTWQDMLSGIGFIHSECKGNTLFQSHSCMNCSQLHSFHMSYNSSDNTNTGKCSGIHTDQHRIVINTCQKLDPYKTLHLCCSLCILYTCSNLNHNTLHIRHHKPNILLYSHSCKSQSDKLKCIRCLWHSEEAGFR